MRSEPLACFRDGGNVIAAARLVYPFNENLLRAGMVEGGNHRNGSEVNPLGVSGGLKEGRIRLAAECNQCDCITEYDERGRKRRKEAGSLESCSRHAKKRGVHP